MEKFTEALANLEKAYARFGKAAETYIPVLLQKRQAAQAEALMAQKRREEAAARAAAKKEFIEKYAPIVQAMWELVTRKYGLNH